MRRILILNTFPSGGGAALAARRTLEGLRALGCEARMLVAAPLPGGESPDYIESIGGFRWTALRYLEKGKTLLALRGDRTNLFRFSTASTGLSGLLAHPWIEWADTINIHWVQQSFLSISQIGKLLSIPGKKFIWTLHDMWPITGGCHSPYTVAPDGATRLCERFLRGCGACPILDGKLLTPNSKLLTKEDLSSRLFAEKMRWPLDRVTFQAISRLAEDNLRRSPIASGGKIAFVPNFFDPATFYVQRDFPRQKQQKQILFAAARPDDPVKGLDLAVEALRKALLSDPEALKGYTFTIVGRPKREELLRDFPIPLRLIPVVSQAELADLYRSSTLTLSASRSETFGLTLLESIACGTPVVTFDLPGPSTFVRHGENGLKVPPFDTALLAKALIRLCRPPEALSPEEVSATVREYERDKVLRRFLSL